MILKRLHMEMFLLCCAILKMIGASESNRLCKNQEREDLDQLERMALEFHSSIWRSGLGR